MNVCRDRTRAYTYQTRVTRIPLLNGYIINTLGHVDHERLQSRRREATAQEIAVELGITPEKVLEIRQIAREPISLDQTLGDEGTSQFGDFIEDSEAVVAVEQVAFTLLQEQLRSILDTLSEREAGVMRLRY